eukprot:m.18933 g.18933  ORF g.18933 m.18933 type:complete len:316 (-) comp5034_c0_seq1:937-1884(-)
MDEGREMKEVMKPVDCDESAGDVSNSSEAKQAAALEFKHDVDKKRDNEQENNSDDESKQVSLQEAFLTFKKKRKSELKQLKKLQKAKEDLKRTPEFKEKLREMFLKQCLLYLGVPYHKKYHKTPECEYFGAPLYLDCCGLVRRALRDLETDFGFKLGGGNQAYQFDTLPHSITKEEMKPGDLVFISGSYFSERSKPQKHDLVHVEVWMGDGDKTVGARYQRGAIQVHDSYAFVSKSYHSMNYHFKSIDTWLDGVCKSFCDEHPWEQRKYSPKSSGGKYAIFNEDTSSSEDGSGDEQEENVEEPTSTITETVTKSQ